MAAASQDRGRQNVLVMADLRVAGAEPCRVSLRNISAGGARLIAPVVPDPGTAVLLELPNVGKVAAVVVWSRPAQNCLGVRFAAEIDPAAVRQKITGSYAVPPAPPAPLRVRLA